MPKKLFHPQRQQPRGDYTTRNKFRTNSATETAAGYLLITINDPARIQLQKQRPAPTSVIIIRSGTASHLTEYYRYMCYHQKFRSNRQLWLKRTRSSLIQQSNCQILNEASNERQRWTPNRGFVCLALYATPSSVCLDPHIQQLTINRGKTSK